MAGDPMGSGLRHRDRGARPMSDAITQLKDDHEKVEKLFRQYEETTDRALKTRRKLVDRFRPAAKLCT